MSDSNRRRVGSDIAESNSEVRSSVNAEPDGVVMLAGLKRREVITLQFFIRSIYFTFVTSLILSLYGRVPIGNSFVQESCIIYQRCVREFLVMDHDRSRSVISGALRQSTMFTLYRKDYESIPSISACCSDYLARIKHFERTDHGQRTQAR